MAEDYSDLVAPEPSLWQSVRKRTGLNEDPRLQEQFVDEYMRDLNAVNAIKRMGLVTRCPEYVAYAFKQEPEVQEMIAQRMEHFRELNGITPWKVLQEYAKIAFFDPKKLFDSHGAPLPINELDDATAGAIAGLKVLEAYGGVGKDRKFLGYTKEYKISDKRSALDSLAKVMNMAPDRVEVTGRDGKPVEIADTNDTARRVAFLLASAIRSEKVVNP